nr:hypothetical protein K-LCC10_0313 [Kaumoebavirus]
MNVEEDSLYFLKFLSPYAEELAALYLNIMMHNVAPTREKLIVIREEADYLRRVPICLER